MALVLDVSITAVWALADESSALADLVAERLKNEIALVPPIWWYEIRNLLVVNERRQRMTASNSAEFLELLASYPIQIEPMEDGSTTLRLARDFGLTFYDASYLATAQRNRLPLATLDRALRTAAIAAGVTALE